MQQHDHVTHSSSIITCNINSLHTHYTRTQIIIKQYQTASKYSSYKATALCLLKRNFSWVAILYDDVYWYAPSCLLTVACSGFSESITVLCSFILYFHAVSHALRAYRYRRYVIRLCVCWSRSWALQKNWTDRDADWRVDSGGPKEPCIKWGQDSLTGKGNFSGCPAQWKPYSKKINKGDSWTAAGAGRLQCSRMVSVILHCLPWKIRPFPCDTAFYQNSLTTCFLFKSPFSNVRQLTFSKLFHATVMEKWAGDLFSVFY